MQAAWHPIPSAPGYEILSASPITQLLPQCADKKLVRICAFKDQKQYHLKERGECWRRSGLFAVPCFDDRTGLITQPSFNHMDLRLFVDPCIQPHRMQRWLMINLSQSLKPVSGRPNSANVERHSLITEISLVEPNAFLKQKQ